MSFRREHRHPVRNYLAFVGCGFLLALALGLVSLGLAGVDGEGDNPKVDVYVAPGAHQERAPASHDDVVRGACLATGSALAGLLVLVPLVWWRGDGYRWRFGLRPSPEIPTELAPAQVAFLWNMRTLVTNGFNATLLDLARRNVIAIEEVRGEAGSVDHRLSVRRDNHHMVRPFERAILEWVFDYVAHHDNATIAELRKDVRKDPAILAIGLDEFRETVVEACRNEGLAPTLNAVGATLACVAAVLVVLGAFAGESMAQAPWLGLWALAALAVLILTGLHMWRPSRAAVALFRRYYALRLYLLSAGSWTEKPAEAVVVWDEYMVLAEALGVALEANRELRIEVGAPPHARYPEIWRASALKSRGH